MTRICKSYEGHECSAHITPPAKRCGVCAPIYARIRQRNYAATKRADAKGGKDFCCGDGAEKLKSMIEQYWSSKGHKIETSLISADYTPKMRSRRVDVRSNLVNGLPS